MLNSRRLLLFPFGVFLLLVGIFAVLLLRHEAVQTSPSPMLDKPLPSINVPLLSGNGVLTPENFKGHYTILNVFASWCAMCQIEHPLLMGLHKDGVRIIGLAWKDEDIKTKAFLEKLGDPYIAVATDHESEAAIALGVTGAPESYLINPEGIMVYRYPGVLTEEIIKTEFLARMK